MDADDANGLAQTATQCIATLAENVTTAVRVSRFRYNTCGMHHIVSLHELSDHPWASWFGEPSLAVSTEALVHTVTFSGKSAYNMAWGYVCPLLEDTETGHILEYCFEEWRSVYNPPQWKEERIGTCGPSGYDTVVTYFWPGNYTCYGARRVGEYF
jgi:hypothetical protein